jgi:hypothetical protein
MPLEVIYRDGILELQARDDVVENWKWKRMFELGTLRELFQGR